MHLPITSRLVELIVLERTGSTNDEVAGRVAVAHDLLTVVTADQTAGRGRLGREWITTAGRGLAVSTLLRMHGERGALPPERWGWIPLIAGAAMSGSIAGLLPRAAVGLKWPNDVLVRDRKVSGILTEVIGGGSAIVVGAGINLATAQRDLPTPESTSLVIEGAVLTGDALADAVTSAWIRALRDSVAALARHGGDAEAAGIRRVVVDACITIGRRVEVRLPAGGPITGTAVDIDLDGRLVVDRGAGSPPVAVAAGDVAHLRYG